MFTLDLLLLLCLVAVGQGQNFHPAPNVHPPKPEEPASLVGQPVLDSTKIQAYAKVSNSFFQNVYYQLQSDLTNKVMSPYGISSAVSLLAEGAIGTTKTEMDNVLNPNNVNVSAKEYYRQMNAVINKSTLVTIDIHNTLKTKPGVSIKPEFRTSADSYYDTAIKENENNNNNGLELMSTVTIYGTWQDEFNPQLTGSSEFYRLNGSQFTLDMMRDVRLASVKKGSTYQVLELNFTDTDYAMYFVLPDDTDGLPDLEQQLTFPEIAEQLLDNLKPQVVSVKLPRMSIVNQIHLDGALKALGINTAFDSTNANFSSITTSVQTYLNQVNQDALTGLYETGTWAAASKLKNPQYTDEDARLFFTADHPFLFLLQHKPSKQLLLQGRFSGLN